MHSLLVITNRDAGTADEESLDRALATLFDQVSVEVVATSDPGELDSVLHRAGSRIIVVAGGDGSLHAVVAALHRRNDLRHSVLGLIPLGTGNDFARAMGVPLDTEEAAHLLVEGEPRRVDLVVDELGEVVVNHVHIGAGVDASRRGARWKERLGRIGYKKVNLGKLGYPIGAVLAALRPRQVRLRIEIDGEVVVDVDQPVLQVAVGNGPSVGGGAELAPGADPEDGKVDVMISHALSPFARLGYAAKLSGGKHPERLDVHFVRARTVSVSGEAFFCSADGEVYGPERQRTWRVEPGAYSMVLPPPTDG